MGEDIHLSKLTHQNEERAVNIDLLRVIFAIIIVVYHIHSINPYFSRGYLGVEFFFFVSGFLLIRNYNANQSTTNLLFHMLKKLLPIILVVQMLTLCFDLCYFNYDFQSGLHLFYCAIGDSFGLYLISPYSGFNLTMWFVSAYFISIMVMHVIIRKLGEDPAKIVSLLIGVIALGYVMATHGVLNVWWTDDYKLCLLLRGIGDVGLGVFSFALVDRIRSVNLSRMGTVIVTIIEVMLLTGIIVFMFSPMLGADEFPIIVMIFILVVLCFSQKSSPAIIKRIGKYSTALASFSVLLFFSHTYWLRKMTSILPEAGVTECILVAFGLTALTLILTYVLSHLVLPRVLSNIKAHFTIV